VTDALSAGGGRDPFAGRIPISVITGFLGSGKTTLLRRLLASPQLARTAVLINEFGDVGLDHLLLEAVDEDAVLLQSGCICCTIRGDLRDAIRGLYDRRERGAIPPFDRLVIETTGLADPTPIIATLLADPVVRHHFRLGTVVATVDAVNGLRHMAENPESVKQAAVADRIVLTKTDIADGAVADKVRAALHRLNPTAPVLDAQAGIEPDVLFTRDLYSPAGKSAEVRRWLAAEHADLDHHGHRDVNRHARGIATFCITIERPLDWTAFGLWLTMLLHAHGADILRVKGILNVAGASTPVVIHGVQHVVHPPTHLKRWPPGPRASRIVFIGRNLDRAAIERSLNAFNRLGTPADAAA
jgi:G3E family GTPase